MSPKAVLFVSLGTLAETCDLRRRAYNAAFAEAGLDWTWDTTTFRCMGDSGSPIAMHAERLGQTVDWDPLARRQQQIFLTMLSQIRVPLRPGVRAVLDAARRTGTKLALVSDAAADDREAVLQTAGLEVDLFDTVAAAPDRPASALCVVALGALRVDPADAIAVVATPRDAAAACAGGIRCVAFPDTAHADRVFPDASERAETLSPSVLLVAPVRAAAEATGTDA